MAPAPTLVRLFLTRLSSRWEELPRSDGFTARPSYSPCQARIEHRDNRGMAPAPTLVRLFLTRLSSTWEELPRSDGFTARPSYSPCQARTEHRDNRGMAPAPTLVRLFLTRLSSTWEELPRSDGFTAGLSYGLRCARQKNGRRLVTSARRIRSRRPGPARPRVCPQSVLPPASVAGSSDL